MSESFKIALCQMRSSFDKEESKNKASSYVGLAAKTGARIVCLPEMWNCPYDNAYFPEYAEPEDGPTVDFLSNIAKNNNVYLIGGSIPESEDGKLYNTSFVFDPSGDKIARHRKVHLFDVDVKGGVSFRESETLSAGDDITLFDTEFGRIGLAICYDVRFAGMFLKMAELGAKLIFLPASFNRTTGPAHWELLMRSRALDNQIYFAACAPAKDPEAKYQSYGHSCIVDPWGEYCGLTATAETILYGDIDFDYLMSVRREIPISTQKRNDLYYCSAD